MPVIKLTKNIAGQYKYGPDKEGFYYSRTKGRPAAIFAKGLANLLGPYSTVAEARRAGGKYPAKTYCIKMDAATMEKLRVIMKMTKKSMSAAIRDCVNSRHVKSQ